MTETRHFNCIVGIIDMEYFAFHQLNRPSFAKNCLDQIKNIFWVATNKIQDYDIKNFNYLFIPVKCLLYKQNKPFIINEENPNATILSLWQYMLYTIFPYLRMITSIYLQQIISYSDGNIKFCNFCRWFRLHKVYPGDSYQQL